ncbi:MAG: UDP-N-acetylmuramate dehydrogenase [Thermodesulfobacteria bacterium]|nr:UDP-N-acetylmuramate dehydrogenase [Thermodesulfobacteriota bacterium]
MKAVALKLKELNIRYQEKVELKKYTTIKIGGVAELLVFPKSIEEVVEVFRLCEENGVPCYVVGGGSKVLIADGEVKAVFVMTKGLQGFEVIERTDDFVRLRLGAGVGINKVISWGISHGYRGLEFLAGIPATIGGSIKMNAGAFGSEVKKLVRRMRLLRGKEVVEVENKEEFWDYRRLKLEGIVLEAELEFERESSERIKEEVIKGISLRRKKQPFSRATFGSVFKNPKGDFAGRLIEAVGLKGKTCGEARISPVHANFIENLGRARAEDVLRLMKEAIEKVFKLFGVILEPEVNLIECRV